MVCFVSVCVCWPLEVSVEVCFHFRQIQASLSLSTELLATRDFTRFALTIIEDTSVKMNPFSTLNPAFLFFFLRSHLETEVSLPEDFPLLTEPFYSSEGKL